MDDDLGGLSQGMAAVSLVVGGAMAALLAGVSTVARLVGLDLPPLLEDTGHIALLALSAAIVGWALGIAFAILMLRFFKNDEAGFRGTFIGLGFVALLPIGYCVIALLLPYEAGLVMATLPARTALWGSIALVVVAAVWLIGIVIRDKVRGIR